MKALLLNNFYYKDFLIACFQIDVHYGSDIADYQLISNT